MKIFYLKQEVKARMSASKQEEAFSIVEALVAAIIIVIILLSTAIGLSSAFRSSATVENSNKASQLASNIVAISRQSTYRDLWVAPLSSADAARLIGNGQCIAQTTVPAGTKRVTAGGSATPFKGLKYCQDIQFGDGGLDSTGQKVGIGSTFYVQTQIVYLNSTAAYDNTGVGSIDAAGKYYAKRVYVTIRWQDVASGEGQWRTYTTSYTKTPTSADCIPDRVLQMPSSGQPSGSPAVSVSPLGCTP